MEDQASPGSDLTAYCDAGTPLHKYLSSHFGIAKLQDSIEAPLEFNQGSWHRKIWVGRPDIEVGGLVELMDNNPIVCADEISVPSPCSTLALIALGPIIRASMLTEAPALQFSMEGNETEIAAFLAKCGWSEGATIQFEQYDLGDACACVAMASITNPEDFTEIDALYDEAYERSFFVQEEKEGEWDSKRVVGKPYALYRLRLTPGESTSLLTIQVMADREGKCGAAQIVHAMNVMAGFEETVGIDS